MTTSGDRAVDDDPGDDDPGDDDTGDDDAVHKGSGDDPGPEAAASGGSATADGGSEEAEAGLPPVEPVGVDELVAAYQGPAAAGPGTLPWSWATLTPAEGEANATLLDGFVESYNRIWAIHDDETVPSCWHRHPALAHDLAALAWAYHQAYRDRDATPGRALQFQAQLPLFARRLDRWLGAEPAECRAGRHPGSWRAAGTTTPPDRSGPEDAHAVVLLGDEAFGFGRAPGPSAVRGGRFRERDDDG